MGRKSKLTDAQWERIGQQLLGGEKARALAKEFSVAESTIRERFSDVNLKIKSVANQIVETKNALKALPISAQIAAHNLADELMAISSQLAGAGKYGAATAHRLSGIVHFKVAEIDDATPLNAERIDVLKGLWVLIKMANESSTIGLSLLAANKEAVREARKPEANPAKFLKDIAALLPN